MGTSTSQRSPATPEWERVRELYKQPNPQPGEVVGRIVAALSPEARQEMHGPSVVPSLNALLWGSCYVAEHGLPPLLEDVSLVTTGPPVISLAATVRNYAQEHIADGRLSSRFGELALDALSNTVMDAAAAGRGLLSVTAAEAAANFGSYAAQQNLAGLSENFLGHDFDHLFRYFVARDIGDFIGTEAFPTVSHGSRLLDDVAHYCRESATQVSLAAFEDQLHEAVALPLHERIAKLEPVVAHGIVTGLGVLAGGH